MNFREKMARGLHLVRMSPGIRGKTGTFRQLALAAARSRLGRLRPPSAETVAANAWADYHVLRFVSRDLNVRLHRDAAPRAWFILPELNAEVIFGGYIALFQFIRFVQKLGIPTGILSLNAIPDPNVLLKNFEGNKLAHDVLSIAEIGTIGPGRRTVRLGAGDMLVSYNWTSSLAAARMARFLDDPAYYYFVQEDERIFYPNDSYRFLCQNVFHQELRPRLICNSRKLHEHFLGQGLIQPDDIAGIFEQAIPPAELPELASLAARSPRRFAFYGRPEDHAKRNLMTIALLALTRAGRAGVFDTGSWEFFMIGSGQMGESFELEGMRVTCLPNQGYEAYRRSLTEFDVGMCLMYAPHPSVPPYEMVRSGVVTVVNTMPGRPAEWYRSISANFEPAEPSVEGLAAAIGRAVGRSGDAEARLAAASSHHPESWEESFVHLPQALRHRIFDTIHEGKAE